MVLQRQAPHPWLLAGPLVGLLSSNLLTMTRGTQGVSSNLLVGTVCKLAVQWSQ